MKSFLVLMLLTVVIGMTLIVASFPVHEAGHYVAVKLTGGEVTRVEWLKWPREDGAMGTVYYEYAAPTQMAGYHMVVAENSSEPNWIWLVNLAGGAAVGVVAFILLGVGLFLRKKNILPNRSDFQEMVVSGTLFFFLGLGILGIGLGLSEMKGIWPY